MGVGPLGLRGGGVEDKGVTGVMVAFVHEKVV